jgi:hypothetical protein
MVLVEIEVLRFHASLFLVFHIFTLRNFSIFILWRFTKKYTYRESALSINSIGSIFEISMETFG